MRTPAWIALALTCVSGCGTKSSPGTNSAADLAPTGDAAATSPIDGISCEKSEQVLFHIHAHVAVFANGVPKTVPAGIGIGPPLVFENGEVSGGSCFSWLHTHDDSGLLHIESPVQRTFTLGNFFDVWGQPLSTSQVGPEHGAVTTFLNGQPFAGDITTIPLDAHNVIQVDIGAPVVSPEQYTFPAGT